MKPKHPFNAHLPPTSVAPQPTQVVDPGSLLRSLCSEALARGIEVRFQPMRHRALVDRDQSVITIHSGMDLMAQTDVLSRALTRFEAPEDEHQGWKTSSRSRVERGTQPTPAHGFATVAKRSSATQSSLATERRLPAGVDVSQRQRAPRLRCELCDRAIFADVNGILVCRAHLHALIRGLLPTPALEALKARHPDHPEVAGKK